MSATHILRSQIWTSAREALSLSHYLSFDMPQGYIRLYLACNKNRVFHFGFLLRETFSLDDLFDCYFEVEFGSRWDLLPSRRPHQNRLVTVKQIVLYNNVLCVIFEHRPNDSPLHVIFRPLRVIFKFPVVTAALLELPAPCRQILFRSPEEKTSDISLTPTVVNLPFLDTTFDKTCGFPGEGPQSKKQCSRMELFIQFTLWNPR